MHERRIRINASRFGISDVRFNIYISVESSLPPSPDAGERRRWLRVGLIDLDIAYAGDFIVVMGWTQNDNIEFIMPVEIQRDIVARQLVPQPPPPPPPPPSPPPKTEDTHGADSQAAK